MFDQDVNRGRRRIREFALEQANRARVLLAAENELFLFLAGRHVGPYGHQGAHQHGHDAHADQQRGHRIAAVSPALSAVERLTR